QDLVPRCAPSRSGRSGGNWRPRLSCSCERRRSPRLLCALWHGSLADKSDASFPTLQGYSQITRSRRTEEALIGLADGQKTDAINFGKPYHPAPADRRGVHGKKSILCVKTAHIDCAEANFHFEVAICTVPS